MFNEYKEAILYAFIVTCLWHIDLMILDIIYLSIKAKKEELLKTVILKY